MKTRSRRGGRPKFSSLSSFTSPSAPNQDVPNAEDNHKKVNEESRKEMRDGLDDVDCFRKDLCIRCDESGELLVCSEISCPIALHECCMSCRPTFDDEGNFYCPYCSYKRALARVNEFRKKAKVAERVLSDFIGFRVVSGNKEKIEEVVKKKVSDVSICANPCDRGSCLNNERLRGLAEQAEKIQTMEGDREKTLRGGQQTVVVNDKNQNNTRVSKIRIKIGHLQLREGTPEIQPFRDSTNGEEIREADTSRTQMVEEENLGSMDHIRDGGIVQDQVQPATSNAHHAEEVTAVDDIDRRTGEEQKIKLSTLGKGDGGEQIQLDEEGMLGSINVRSRNKDVSNEAFVKKKKKKKKHSKSRASRRLDLEHTDLPRKSPRIKNPEPEKNHVTKIEKVSAFKNLKQRKESPKQVINLNIHSGKRKRLHWSTEEEEMLKEGVQKFSSTANKNLPWRKVLEFGRHIFDETRTPVDLKDKWRNILAKNS